jgi:hypothetical protein
VPAASCLSECAITSEASIRITIVVPSSRSATREGGIRPCRLTINDHTCSRVVAGTWAILRRCPDLAYHPLPMSYPLARPPMTRAVRLVSLTT